MHGAITELAQTIVGKRSPEFVVNAVVDGKVKRINSLEFYGSYLLIFFYNADFSFVCPTELHALQEALPAFKAKNVKVLAASVDSVQTHLAWLHTLRSQGGIEGITFTIISDIHKKLARAYCILDEKTGLPLRGTFFVDRNGTVQYGSVHSHEIGRDIEELLRIIDAIQFTETHGELCPVNWKPGETAIKYEHS